MHYKTYFDTLTDEQIIEQLDYLKDKYQQTPPQDKMYVGFVIDDLRVYVNRYRHTLAMQGPVSQKLRELGIIVHPNDEDDEEMERDAMPVEEFQFEPPVAPPIEHQNERPLVYFYAQQIRDLQEEQNNLRRLLHEGLDNT